MAPSLVSCEWLNDKIKSGNLGNIVILDVSWYLAGDAYDNYKKKHITGAGYINVLDAQHTKMLIRNLPTAEHFTELARNAGVNKSSHVVVYSCSDKADQSGFYLAGRGWWSFKVFGFENVSILDGGLTKWQQLGLPVTTELPTIKRGDFEAKSIKRMYKGYDDVVKNIKKANFQLVDTRASGMYTADHIPNAKNLPMANVIDEGNMTMKTKKELQSEFTKAGVDLKQPIAVHCTGGMSSCTIAFVAELLGQDDIGVFPGGFTEWLIRQASQTQK